MDTILQFIQNQPWYGVVTAVIALASAIAALTPTPTEGSTLAKLYKIIDVLALNVGKAKDKGAVVAQPVEILPAIKAVTTSSPKIPKTSTTPSPEGLGNSTTPAPKITKTSTTPSPVAE